MVPNTIVISIVVSFIPNIKIKIGNQVKVGDGWKQTQILLKTYLKPLFNILNNVMNAKTISITNQLLNIKDTLSNTASMNNLSANNVGNVPNINLVFGRMSALPMASDTVSHTIKNTKRCFANFILILLFLPTVLPQSDCVLPIRRFFYFFQRVQ